MQKLDAKQDLKEAVASLIFCHFFDPTQVVEQLSSRTIWILICVH